MDRFIQLMKSSRWYSPTSFKGEEWVDIKGWEGYYQISNAGRVKSLARTVRSGFGGGRSLDDLILKPQTIDGKYTFVTLRKPLKEQPVRIHRLVAEHFVPNPHEGKYIEHKNGNLLDNRYTNLCWKKPFTLDKERNDFIKTGRRGRPSRLTEDDVIRIYIEATKGTKTTELAAAYNVNNSTISQIKSGKSWGHLTKEIQL